MTELIDVADEDGRLWTLPKSLVDVFRQVQDASPGNKLAEFSQWVDDGQPEATRSNGQLMMHIRTNKLSEETGEVTKAVIGTYGENPRKGFTHTQTDIIDELLDVAVTALGAVEHITGNQGEAIKHLFRKIEFVHGRVLAPTSTGEEEKR